MRVLVCPQEFKGSLTTFEATRAIAEGARRALPAASVEEQPLADGGLGTVGIVTEAAGGVLVAVEVSGPLREPVTARYGLLPQQAAGDAATAVIEAASAAGLALVPAARRDPGLATTFGVGELIVHALDRGARELIVGVGGTATNDGGAGAAQALGYRLLDRDREPLPQPAGGIHLLNVFAIDPSGVDRRLAGVDLRVAVDVTNPLLGPDGATAVYGPQKGVVGELGEMLEDALARWARAVQHDLGVDLTDLTGGGAGGGLAAGLIGAIGGQIQSGAALVAEAVGLDDAIRRADLVVTGEGRLDAQTAFGKTVALVAERCAALGKPCVAVAGSAAGVPEGLADVEPATPGELPEAEAMARAAELVPAAAERLLRRGGWQAGA